MDVPLHVVKSQVGRTFLNGYCDSCYPYTVLVDEESPAFDGISNAAKGRQFGYLVGRCSARYISRGFA